MEGEGPDGSSLTSSMSASGLVGRAPIVENLLVHIGCLCPEIWPSTLRNFNNTVAELVTTTHDNLAYARVTICKFANTHFKSCA